MAQVPATSYESTSLGDVAEFTIPFPFLSRAEVFVTVDGAQSAFTWINDGLIQLPEIPELGAIVRRYRSTAAYVPLHQFSQGVPFLPRYVDRDFTQTLYAVQESVNDTAGTAALALDTAELALDTAQDALALVGERTQYMVLGPYGPGLYFQTTSQVFSYMGEFYAPGPSIVLPYTTTGSGAVEIANFRSVGDAILRSDLASADPAAGAHLVSANFGPDVSFSPQTVQEVLQETILASSFGVSVSNPDNSAELERIRVYCASFAPTGLLPRVVFTAGEYSYATSPNWAMTGLTIEAIGNVVFRHTGTGIAFNLDGGSSGPGVYGVQVLGKLRVAGNANTTWGVYARAVHHSRLSFRPRDCDIGMEAVWCVCTEIDFRCSPVGYPSFSKVPNSGLVLSARGAGENTSACIIQNPIVEGVNGYGIRLLGAVQNRIVGGTSESNSGGIFLSSAAGQNIIDGLDLEFNTGEDVFCQGVRNSFNGILSDNSVTMQGQDNTIVGGLFNAITNSGTSNNYTSITYGSVGGAFTDIGPGTVKRTVRNLISGALDPELMRNPYALLYLAGPAGNNTVMGSDDQIGGGSANDFSMYHYGAGEVIQYANGLRKIRVSGSGVGFNDQPPLVRPTITGSRGGNAALASLISALTTYGLVLNGTTA